IEPNKRPSSPDFALICTLISANFFLSFSASAFSAAASSSAFACFAFNFRKLPVVAFSAKLFFNKYFFAFLVFISFNSFFFLFFFIFFKYFIFLFFYFILLYIYF